ncbi:MAG: hypothetical protein FWF77_05345 [Defluviitaleaceae bacterium]|nr:hypothetical protein [Defluviitaleaceae bacterium]
MEKSEYFEEIIAREVEARRRRVKHQLANDLSKSHAAEIEAAQKRVNLRVDTARKNFSRKANRDTAVAVRCEKSAHSILRNSLQAKLLDDVYKELVTFANSPKYEEFLLTKINLLRGEFSVVLLRPEDMRFAEKIREATGLAPKEGESDYIGGFILQSGDGKIRADFTFKLRLENIGATWTDL